MKYCKHCGNELRDSDIICNYCGGRVSYERPISQWQDLRTKFCRHCGNEILKEAIICPRCGCPVRQSNYTRRIRHNGFAFAAKVIFIISTIIMGFYIIPLLWCVPMTSSYCSKIKNGEEVSVGFKICLLLFVNFFGGILALCDKQESENY